MNYRSLRRGKLLVVGGYAKILARDSRSADKSARHPVLCLTGPFPLGRLMHARRAR